VKHRKTVTVGNCKFTLKTQTDSSITFKKNTEYLHDIQIITSHFWKYCTPPRGHPPPKTGVGDLFAVTGRMNCGISLAGRKN